VAGNLGLVPDGSWESIQDPTDRWRRLWAFATHNLQFAILVCFVLLAVTYGLVVPPFENLDEVEHFGVVRYIAETGQLPVHGMPEAEIYHYPLSAGGISAAAILYTFCWPGQAAETAGRRRAGLLAIQPSGSMRARGSRPIRQPRDFLPQS